MCANFVFLGMAEKKYLHKIFRQFHDCLNEDDRPMSPAMSFEAFENAVRVIEIDNFLKQHRKNTSINVLVLPEDYFLALKQFAEGEKYLGMDIVLNKDLPDGQWFLTSRENYTNSRSHYEQCKEEFGKRDFFQKNVIDRL